MNNEAPRKLQTAGRAEREAREVNKRKLAWDVAIQIRERLETSAPIWAQDVADLILPALDTWAARCANEARLEALEQAAVLASHPYGNEVEAYGVDEPSVVGYKIAAAIRALKAAPAVAGDTDPA